MASNSSATRELARLGKRFVHWASAYHLPAASLSPLAGFRRNLHPSMYDKNVDEHVRPAVVPDEVIKPQSERYWAPNPETGVFGPANDNNSSPSPGERGEQRSAAESVVEENAFFRPLEGLEKPHHP